MRLVKIQELKIGIESHNSACVKSREFDEVRFNWFDSWWDCWSAPPILKVEASHIA